MSSRVDAELGYDLAAASAHLRQVEPRFAPLIERHGLPDLTPTKDPYLTLARTIIFQQLAGAAAETIFGRFVALFGKFPRPAVLAASSVEHLRQAGLSRGKALALLDLAAHFADRRVTSSALLRASDAEVATLLLPVRGIGPWSVDMFLMFGLCRPDIWPIGDLGVRMGLKRFLRLRSAPDPARMNRVAHDWKPWRSLSAWYMWRVLEDERKR